MKEKTAYVTARLEIPPPEHLCTDPEPTAEEAAEAEAAAIDLDEYRDMLMAGNGEFRPQ